MPTAAGATSLMRPRMLLGVAMASFGASGCFGDATAPAPQPGAVALLSGESQTGAVATPLAEPLVVAVSDVEGRPLGGIEVSWAASQGHGSLEPATSVTNVDGQASAEWLLGPTAGAQTATAMVAGLSPVHLAATAAPDAPADVRVTPESLSFTALAATTRLEAAVSDRFGNVIDEPALVWSSADTVVAHVDPNGLVSSRGPGESRITVRAGTAAGTTAVVVEQAPETLAIHAGDEQTGPAGAPLPDSLIVKVADANGFGVAGVTVRFLPGADGGAVSPTDAVSDASGLASTRWTLGPAAGADRATAESPGVDGSPLSFAATATPNGRIAGTLTVTGEAGSAAVLTQPEGSAPGAGVAGEGRRSVVALGGDAIGVRADPGSVAEASDAGLPTEHVPGSLIVTYASDALGAPAVGARAHGSMATAARVGADLRGRLAPLASRHGFQVRGVSPAILAARVRVDPERLDAIQAMLRRDPAVAAVEREAIARSFGPAAPSRRAATAAITPDDPLYRPQMWHYRSIDLPAAWGITTGDADVLVAVVDDGIRFDHPSVAANLTTDGYDFVSQLDVSICGDLLDNAGDGDGYDPDPTSPIEYDPSTCLPATFGVHGLHVAGTIGAAGNDGYGVTGVNWAVRIRPVRVLGIGGTGTFYDVAQGILYAAGLPADDGDGGVVQAPSAARVINLSLGAGSGTTDLQNAVRSATVAGALLIAAAGNGGSSAAHYPAAYAEVVSVSAVGPDWQLASYSNFGSTIDIAAPGGDFADGGGSYGVASSTWDFQLGQPSHAFYQGTSMATPHVTGVAALLLARAPPLTLEQLRSRLLDYAVDLGPEGWDQQFGHGLVNGRNSLTETLAPVADLYARLYDGATGAVLDLVPAGGDGTYEFSALDDGAYFVFAGTDEEGDGLVGLPGRPWGAFGDGAAAPDEVLVEGAGTYAASFAVGTPQEAEPNGTSADADRLMPYGYLNGAFATSTDVDVYKATAVEGQYTFETSGVLGSCGWADEADTVLELYDGGGALIASNDDIDTGTLNYCSRIKASLQPGEYELRVRYRSGGPRYRLEARPGA